MFGIQKEGGGPGITAQATQFAQAQGGNSESLNELIQRHEGLVYLVVQRQWLLTLPYEDALQAGRMGLWRAILGYNPEQGSTFATYAYKAIMRHVWSAVKAERGQEEREVPVGVWVAACYEPGPDPAGLKDQWEVGESLLELVKRLPKRLRGVIVTYYGLRGKEPQTLRAIGKQLSLSGERVRQLRNEALVWLRQPAHSQALRSLMARHNQTQYELADQLAQIWLKQRGGRHGRR